MPFNHLERLLKPLIDAEVTIAGRISRSNRLEAEVLALLIDRSRAVVGREEIISAIWCESAAQRHPTNG